MSMNTIGQMLRTFGVKAEYLDAAFDEMQMKYGTIDNYFLKGRA